jgi:DNA-directed RNA polymerase subunit RPC12/RpoP
MGKTHQKCSKEELLKVINFLEMELKNYKKEVQTLRRKVNRMRSHIQKIKETYDSVIDFQNDPDNSPIPSIEKAKENAVATCPNCGSREFYELDLPFLYKKNCKKCNHEIEKIRKNQDEED